ncbi:MAG: tetratricopeptide repeat protein [Vicinamibacterales bacterium]
MAFDREDTLKKAEKLLRQGRVEPAIAEYLRLAEADPSDWMTANTLGDLYVRAGQSDKAAAEYARVADHFVSEGFYPRAAAIFKKLLKLNPEDETAQLQLADISQRQGLLADAKAQLNAVAARRRARGDRAGTAAIVVLLGDVDPNDFEARATAARTVAEMGDDQAAAARYRAIHDDLIEKDRPAEALEALRQAVAHNPHDQEGRVALAKAAVQAGDAEGARAYLDRATAGHDPALLAALLEIELKANRLSEARDLVPVLLAIDRAERQRILDIAWTALDGSPDAAFALIDALADSAAADHEFHAAADLLQAFVTRVPNHVAALLNYVRVSVEGGLDDRVNEARGQLTDAYLSAGQAAEARAAAEDLIAREPWERTHMERFRRALVMLRISDPDTVIADRLGGRSPFLATVESGAASNRSENAEPPPAGPATFESAPHELTNASAQAPAPAPPPATFRQGAIPVSTIDAGDDDSSEIDLNEMLGDADEQATEAAAPAEALGNAFRSVREDVTRQSGADQSAQHMTLARTYMEIGLPGQALEPLRTAAESPQFRFEAASLLGRIHKDRGEVEQAIHWLERASTAPEATAGEGRAVTYDLASLLADTGETDRALAIFLDLQSSAGDYRDVPDRIEQLTGRHRATGKETEG